MMRMITLALFFLHFFWGIEWPLILVDQVHMNRLIREPSYLRLLSSFIERWVQPLNQTRVEFETHFPVVMRGHITG